MRHNQLAMPATLDFDDEQDVEVIINIKLHGPAGEDGWDINSVERASDGNELVLTSDLDAAVCNHVNDNIWEAISEAEEDYADYRYEQWKDERMMESWND